MGVNISKLWNKASFNQLKAGSKLLYIYLATNPSINSVGVINIDLKLVSIHLGVKEYKLEKALEELINSSFIHLVEAENIIYYIVPQHFKESTKSNGVKLTINMEYKSLPNKVQKLLKSLGISPDSYLKPFVKPTREEVFEYALSKGYVVDADKFIEYYDNMSEMQNNTTEWIDGRGRPFTNWKMKCYKVWCKPDRKIKLPKNAPKGFESLHVIIDDKCYVPTEWRNGLPIHSDFLIAKELKKEYDRRTKSC